MDSPEMERVSHDGASELSIPSSTNEVPFAPEVPSTPKREAQNGAAKAPITPMRGTPSRITFKEPASTPRIKKKVPWKGKNIMVLLPRDDQRGKPGEAPIPLNPAQTINLFRSWEELGYNISGFDLEGDSYSAGIESDYSQSRGAWPDSEDIVRERSQRIYKVTLPDLHAWKDYVNELNEAKLRALGVSFGNDDPPPASISPVTSAPSRQASVQYPPLPFSPPVPTSSASSNPALPGYQFPPAFVPGNRSSAVQSPAIPAGASPVSFAGLPAKFNPRASISIPAGASPFQLPQQPSPQGWPPQLMQHGLNRVDSPSMLSMQGILSPTSPFDSMPLTGSPALNMHQRHQSLQYPMLPHQQFVQQPVARASPRLHDVREVEEEPMSKSPSKTPEPPKMNPESLQAEIDDAEYHLEEQLRNELEHEDYSPHNPAEKTADAREVPFPISHGRQQSVQFSVPEPFSNDPTNAPVLHHPRPHSRGHSLAQNFYSDDARDSTDDSSAGKLAGLAGLGARQTASADESHEIETNPSNLGTPVQNLDFASILEQHQHQRSFSGASNPWDTSSSVSNAGIPRRSSHASKPSISKLKADAPEFKFNPTSNFQPGQFVFSSNTFQPAIFQASTFMPAAAVSPSVNSGSFSVQSASSRINAAAPAFSPGQSEFNFSASGPKFRPDAPSFTPMHSVSDSITSPGSGNESSGNRTSSIFGNIDLSQLSDMVKPVKKSKAIPIVRPDSTGSLGEAKESVHEDPDGRLTDESRIKRVRGAGPDRSVGRDDGAVHVFAEPTPEPSLPTPEALSQASPTPEAQQDADIAEKQTDDEQMAPADTSMSSTILSEQTDAKATAPATATSPSETSPEQAGMNWTPFEFESGVDMASFNDARPFGEDVFRKGHKKSLSATAQAFVPGATLFGQPNETDEDEAQQAELEEEDEPEHEPETPAAPPAQPSPLPAFEPTPPLESRPFPASSPLTSKTVESPTVAPRRKGLMASRFASSPSPEPEIPAEKEEEEQAQLAQPEQAVVVDESDHAAEGAPELTPSTTELIASESESKPHLVPDPELAPPARALSMEETMVEEETRPPTSPTFEEIDAVMQHLNEHDPTMGVNKSIESPKWHHPSPTRHISLAAVTNSSPLHLQPQSHFRSDAPSPSPQQYRALPGELAPPILTTELEDPFIDPPQSATAQSFEAPVRRLNASEGLPASDWDRAFSDDEAEKLEQRVQFFDGRVNELVGGLLTARLGPLEKTLDSLRHVLATMARRTPSSRRERRSVSAELEQSDADDEDDEPMPRRSMSPRRDKRMEQIRVAVMEAMATQQRSAPPAPVMPSAPETQSADNSTVLKALEEMKEQFGASMRLDFRGEDLRNIVEDAVERRMPQTPQPVIDHDTNTKLSELQAKVLDLEQRLHLEQTRVEKEVAERRAAEDLAAELNRKLQSAETRVEVEIINRSAFDQRIADLDDRLRHQEEQTEAEMKSRHAAEDRLSEVQRLLRIASEEETRLREVVDDREQKMKAMEQSAGKTTMRLALLEAAQTNSSQSHAESTNKINVMETDLREARKEASRWQSEADRAMEAARRREADAHNAIDENKHLHKLLDTLGTQLQENERMRDNWRTKFVSLQEDMTRAAQEITQENAQRSKKEQALMARQEVLDARLQAESRTRERLEKELERLEMGERQGMRAVSECKRLEALLAEVRTENHQLQENALRFQRDYEIAMEAERLLGDVRAENHQLQQNVLRHQREFEEARESGAREVQRTRVAMQAEIDSANDQVNAIRDELEDHIAKLRAEVDHVKMEADTAKAQSEMLLEEAQTTKQSEVEDLVRKHQNELEDLQARYERQLSTRMDEAQSAEKLLLERLSLSTSKSDHLQDRVNHLEERLEIAKEAALAAAQAAKSATAEAPAAARAKAPSMPSMQLPEKVSPQALRETILVLQEQLLAREQRIEELEQRIAQLDPEAPTKIAKRDDEIIWLRELLAVRHGDLQDIIAALSADDFDRDAVKDAAIRLKANLQMEEQERERAMNGGSAINLPNIAQTIRDAATPRVAQAVGPLAAAWGNWRKNQPAIGSLSGILSSPAPVGNSNNSTPARSSPSQSSFLGGLLTPPASGLRQQTPPTAVAQPTAFQSTGRRLTAEQLASRARGPSMTARQAEKAPLRSTPPRRQSRGEPVTPPMMLASAYDSDANPGDFDDRDFFED